MESDTTVYINFIGGTIKETMGLLRWLVMACAVWTARGYLIGEWRIQPHHSSTMGADWGRVVFRVNESCVVSDSDMGSLRMDIQEWESLDTHEGNGTQEGVALVLANLTVIRAPRDWYNVHKYAFFLYQYHAARRGRVRLRLRFMDRARDQVHLDGEWADYPIPVIHLERYGKNIT